MPAHRIVGGQAVSGAKVQRAKELRRRMTTEETVLWERLRAHRLRGLHFRRQQVIDGFIVDFYCHAASLVVELDGDVHAAQADYDLERDRILARRGLRVLRVSNADVQRNLPEVLARIAAAAETPYPSAPLRAGCPPETGG
jgi:very-short-patch-repair endonuclease